MTKLRALFILVGALVVGGGSYELYVLKPQYAVGDAIDAGLLPVTNPARLSCRVRIKESCRAALGGLKPYVRLPLKARISKPASPVNFIAFDVPNAWQDCIVPVGTPEEACDVVENGACTDATICAPNYVPTPEVDACACSTGSGCFKPDGGVAVAGITLAAGTWTGAGCKRKFCGPEIAGEQGQSWPPECGPP